MYKKKFNISLTKNYEKFFFHIDKNFFKLFVYNKEDFIKPNINILLIKKLINNYFIFKFYFLGNITLFCDLTFKKFIFKIKKKKET
ncbi:MAG: hypothetical protein NHG09_00410 [Candidatus Shikimatogenerans sp. JK-2022]|nr:hypothetical protein [Candidatus Shikimatogenerans bostrichidophilus]